jgi:hypothetical protein
VIARFADHTWDLAEMGRRARRLAETSYDRRAVTARFRALLEGVLGTATETAREVVAPPPRREERVPSTGRD